MGIRVWRDSYRGGLRCSQVALGGIRPSAPRPDSRMRLASVVREQALGYKATKQVFLFIDVYTQVVVFFTVNIDRAE